jgi:hypothetical protein
VLRRSLVRSVDRGTVTENEREGGFGMRRLITSIAGNTMNVARGYRGTTAASHAGAAAVYAGPERITITRAVSAAPHPVGSVTRAGTRVLSVSSHTGLASATTIQIDSEKFKTTQRSGIVLTSNASTLSAGIDASQTTLSAAGPASGTMIRIDAEYMAVTSIAGSTVGVRRGMWGTPAAAHNGASIVAALASKSNTIRVTRAALGTTAASHASGADIMDVDGLGSFTASLSGPGGGVIAIRTVAVASMLGSTSRTVSCPTATTTDTTADIQCQSSGSALGPAGSGVLARFDVAGLLLEPFTPSKTVSLTGTAADVSGDVRCVP